MATRLGWWYAVGPRRAEILRGHPDYSLLTVVSYEASVPGCVTVENLAAVRQFPVDYILIDEGASPPDRGGERPLTNSRFTKVP